MRRDLHFEVTYPHPRRLAYTWQGGWVGEPTVVRYTLEPVSDGTHLRLDHCGFQGIGGLALSFLLGSGWKTRILRRNLPRVLEGLASSQPARVER